MITSNKFYLEQRVSPSTNTWRISGIVLYSPFLIIKTQKLNWYLLGKDKEKSTKLQQCMLLDSGKDPWVNWNIPFWNALHETNNFTFWALLISFFPPDPHFIRNIWDISLFFKNNRTTNQKFFISLPHLPIQRRKKKKRKKIRDLKW